MNQKIQDKLNELQVLIEEEINPGWMDHCEMGAKYGKSRGSESNKPLPKMKKKLGEGLSMALIIDKLEFYFNFFEIAHSEHQISNSRWNYKVTE